MGGERDGDTCPSPLLLRKGRESCILWTIPGREDELHRLFVGDKIR